MPSIRHCLCDIMIFQVFFDRRLFVHLFSLGFVLFAKLTLFFLEKVLRYLKAVSLSKTPVESDFYCSNTSIS